MKDKNTNNSLKFNKFSFLALLDGLDTFLIYLLSLIYQFFFQNFDARLSIPITSFVVLLSFFQETIYFVFSENFYQKQSISALTFIFSFLFFTLSQLS